MRGLFLALLPIAAWAAPDAGPDALADAVRNLNASSFTVRQSAKETLSASLARFEEQGQREDLHRAMDLLRGAARSPDAETHSLAEAILRPCLAGNPLWQEPIAGHVSNLTVTTTGVVVGGMHQEGGSNWVECRDARTGKSLWRRKVPLTSNSTVSHSLDGGMLLVGTGDGRLAALIDPEDGNLWELPGAGLRLEIRIQPLKGGFRIAGYPRGAENAGDLE